MCGKLRDQPHLLCYNTNYFRWEGNRVTLGAGGGGGSSLSVLVRTFTCGVMALCHVCCHVSCHDAGSLSLEHSLTGRLTGTKSLAQH